MITIREKLENLRSERIEAAKKRYQELMAVIETAPVIELTGNEFLDKILIQKKEEIDKKHREEASLMLEIEISGINKRIDAAIAALK